MATAARPPSGADAGKKNWLLLCTAGAFIVAAGLSAPRLLDGHGGLAPVVQTGGEKTAPPPAPEPAPPDDWPAPRDMLIRLGGGTGLVLLLGVAILLVCRRWFRPGPPDGTAGERQFELIETLHLGNRCCVHLVRAGRQHLLTGADATGLKAVAALVDPEEELLGPSWGDEPGSLAGKLREWQATAEVLPSDRRGRNG